MDNNNSIFGKKNVTLLIVGVVIIIVGFLLMVGPGSSYTEYQPDIFSWRRIWLAPSVTLFGFLFIIYAIMANPDKKKKE